MHLLLSLRTISVLPFLAMVTRGRDGGRVCLPQSADDQDLAIARKGNDAPEGKCFPYRMRRQL